MVWNTVFIDRFSTNLAFLAVEHYPIDNCYMQFRIGTPHAPQTLFPTYLNHGAGKAIVALYLNLTTFAQMKGKQLLMFETNLASCGSFSGISNSFGVALWGLDYGMQMANSNFSGALFHVGGQNVFYNVRLHFLTLYSFSQTIHDSLSLISNLLCLGHRKVHHSFVAPPTNQSTFYHWTIGPIYYSALIMAEALRPMNSSQVLDLVANSNNMLTPAYAVYKNCNPIRVLLFNYISDPAGVNTITVNISIGGGQMGQANATPLQVQVKWVIYHLRPLQLFNSADRYLLAPSVTSHGQAR